MESSSGMTMDQSSDQMFFEATNHATILFRFWKTRNDWEVIVSAVVVVILGVFCEYLKLYKDRLLFEQRQQDYLNTSHQVETTPVFKQLTIQSLLSLEAIHTTLIYFLHLGLSYLLMLAAMTFNVWIFMAVLTGLTIGFVLFNWKRNF